MIIALIGENGVGKTTVSKIFKRLFKKNNKNLKRKSFAKKVNKTFFQITGTDFHSLSREEKEKVRPLFIKYAEGCKKVFGEDVWVKGVFKNYDSKSDIIIDDLRFPIELEAVKQRGGIIIEIIKGNETAYEEAYRKTHRHLKDNIKPDFLIENNGTIEELAKKVKIIYEEFK